MPKYYKVLAPDGASPTKVFDYSPYLPKREKAGKWLPRISKAKLREEGYYVSARWNMWYAEGARVYEVECEGMDIPENCAVEKQACCQSIRLMRDVTEELLPLLKDARGNISEGNTGKGNDGSSNSGDFNIGSRNTGALNRGNFNTGDNNVGLDNVGDDNVGTGNVGCGNIGHSNTGSGNKGSFNSGAGNEGNGNTGSFNVGNFNVGKWNLGSCHSGFFNSLEQPVRMFDKPTNLRQRDIVLPKWLNSKDCKKLFWLAPKKDIEAALALPNFDHDIFEKITGISRADFEKKLGEK